MAFMIPVVRKDWEVLSDSGKNRSTKKGSRQNSECHSKENLSSSALQQSGTRVTNNSGSRSQGIQTRYSQNSKITTGSLPSNVHSVHLSSNGQVYASAIPPRVYKSICDSYPVSHQRTGHTPALQSKPAAVSTVSLPAATANQDTPISTKQKSLLKSSGSLLERLRRSIRLHSSSSAEDTDNAEDDIGTRASS